MSNLVENSSTYHGPCEPDEESVLSTAVVAAGAAVLAVADGADAMIVPEAYATPASLQKLTNHEDRSDLSAVAVHTDAQTVSPVVNRSARNGA